MTNQSSIKYISSLLDNPSGFSDGDHGSVSLFRQTFPYFVPARYILALERHRKSPFDPAMISEIQPYMGNWMLLCELLENGGKGAKEGQGIVTGNEKKHNDIAAFLTQEQKESGEKKPGQKVPGFIQAGNAGQQKQSQQSGQPLKDNKSPEQPAKPEVKPAMQPAAAQNTIKKEESKKPEVKTAIPPVTPAAAEAKTAPKEEPKKPVYPEPQATNLPVTPVAEAKAAPKEEPKKPGHPDIKIATPPVTPVVTEAKMEMKEEQKKPEYPGIKTATPPVTPGATEAKIEPKEEPKKQDYPGNKTATPPVTSVVAETKTEQKEEPKKPEYPEIKIAPPPATPVVAESKTEPKEEPKKPEYPEIKIAPPPVTPAATEAKTEPKEEPTKPGYPEIQIAPPPVTPAATETKTAPKEEPKKPGYPEIKMATPPVTPAVTEVKTEQKEAPVKIEAPMGTGAPEMAVEKKENSAQSSEIKQERSEKPVQPAEAINSAPVEINLAGIPDEGRNKESTIFPDRAEEQKTMLTDFIPTKVSIDKGMEKDNIPGAIPTQGIKLVAVRIPEDAPATDGGGEIAAETAMQQPVDVGEKVQKEMPSIPDEQGETPTGKEYEDAEDEITEPAFKEPIEYYEEEAIQNEANEPLISPVYTEDYFLQQGVKVSLDIPDEIDELKEPAEADDEDKSLMVMMSFSEWLLHFKNTAEKQKEEKKDQKALKTMWQKEKLAAAMEEENEEIPENVFEMAVNSIAKEDGLASESLAEIYKKQGKYDKAIEMYRKLSLQNPKKNTYFARKIEEILKEKQS
jgi:hypothetical protein